MITEYNSSAKIQKKSIHKEAGNNQDINAAFMMSRQSDKTNLEDLTDIFLSSNLLFSQGLILTSDLKKQKEHNTDVILNISIKEDLGDDLKSLHSEKRSRVSSLQLNDLSDVKININQSNDDSCDFEDFGMKNSLDL